MNSRPVLNIPRTKLEKWHDVSSILVWIAVLIYLFVVWPKLPSKVPSHVNAAGEINNWSGKGILFIMPVISLLLYVLFTFLSRYPHVFNYMKEITEENARQQYTNARLLMSWIKVEIVIWFAYISWEMVHLAKGGHDLGATVFFVMLAVLLGTIIFYARRGLRI
ncbi:DUF1648 domain-containing protein [Microbacteriaceae bacterium 4G12]